MQMRLKRLLVWTALGILGVFAVAFIGGIAAGYLTAKGYVTEDQALLSVMGPIAAVLMLGALAIGWVWMRSIDEAARTAHKTAWFWGGSAGMALGGVGVILAMLPSAERWTVDLGGRTDPAYYMAAGAFGMICLLCLGYTIAWAWWWFSHSRA
jgi:hypothetical protein